MTKLGLVLGLLAASTMFGGCLGGYPEDPHPPGEVRQVPPPDDTFPDDPANPTDPYQSPFDGTLVISDGHLGGSMGDVRDFEGDATSSYGYQGGNYASITVTTTNETAGYSAMTILDLEGGVDNPALTPGASFHFDGVEQVGGVYLYVTGCSGPREGSWMFDSGADDVTLDVSEGSTPDTLRMDFDATFTGSGTTEGSFEVGVPQTQS
jgi:hypothetical protein